MALQINIEQMTYNNLGISNIKVSEICLGTMTFGNPVSKNQAIEMVHWAIDRGINFYDTADIYEGYNRHANSKGGVSEQFLGVALKGKRDKVVVTTKVGNSIGGSYKGSGLNKKHIEHQINQSLTRLRTDYIDVYQMHKPDLETPIEESIQVFIELIKMGKIRHWGVSNFNTIQLKELLETCELNSWEKPIVSQSAYSWLNRNIEEDLFPLLAANNLSLTPYRILEGGLLTGKYQQENQSEENRLKKHPQWISAFNAASLLQMEKYNLEAKNSELSPTQYAAKWLLKKTIIPSVLVGARKINQIEPFLSH